ncbi:MAG: DNA polymerase Y family protein [Actinomycetaceae bacterium]|nr:DNA polymerase Y family protein [Actinomycetaceae bacterium]
MSRIAMIWFPDWETNALVIDCPPGASAALVSARGRITHVTRQARSFGVLPGMKRALAEYMCPDLIVLPDDRARSARSFNVVLEALDEVSATVCAIRPGIVWVPASAARTFGGEEQLCERIVDAVAQRTGSECYVGIGNGVLEAWVAALHGVIDPGENRVNDLNIALLKPLLVGVENEIDEVVSDLESMGARTVADLRRIGAGHVLSRFGAVGQGLHRILEQNIPLSRSNPVPDASVEQPLDFPSPVADLGIVLGYLLEQSTHLVERLVARQVAASAVDITAVMATPKGDVERTRQWSIIDFPTPRDLVDRTRWQVQSWVDEIMRGAPCEEEYSQETFGVKSVVLTARNLVPIDDLSQRLWGNRSAEDTRGAATAFRLQALVGVDGVRQPRVRGGFDPVTRAVEAVWGEVEHHAAWEDWQLPDKWADHASFQPERQWVGAMEGRSPATVLEEPIPIALFDESGQAVKLRIDATLDATPRSVTLEHEEEAVWEFLNLVKGEEIWIEQVRGPWPVLGRWWDSEAGMAGARAWLIIWPSNTPQMLIGWFSGRWMLVAMWY